MTTIPAWSDTLIAATAAVACAMSASVTRPPGTTGWAGAGAGAAGVAAGGVVGGALGGSAVEARAVAAEDELAADGVPDAAELAAGDVAVVGGACWSACDSQLASSAAVASTEIAPIQVRRGRVTRTPSSTGSRGRYR